MSFDSAKWVRMNGRCVRWDEATVHVSAHGLHYGSRSLGVNPRGCPVEVTPVCELDGTPVGAGRRGAIAERIQRAFFDATSGRDARYAGWLRHVAAPPVSSY